MDLGTITVPTDASAPYEIDQDRESTTIVPYHPDFREYPTLYVDVLSYERDGRRPVWGNVGYPVRLLEDHVFPYTAEVPAGQCRP